MLHRQSVHKFCYEIVDGADWKSLSPVKFFAVLVYTARDLHNLIIPPIFGEIANKNDEKLLFDESIFKRMISDDFYQMFLSV